VECYRKSEAQPNLDSHPERESRGRQEQRVMNSMYKALKTLEELQAQSKLARAVAKSDVDQALAAKDKEIAELKEKLAGFVPHPSQDDAPAGAWSPVPPTEFRAQTEEQPEEQEEKRAA
jgi:hypothetical protein